MLGNLKGKFMEQKFQVVIADESHKIRTSLSKKKMPKCSTVTMDVIRNAKRAILLSGTPCVDQPFDLFHQIDSLRPGL